MPWNSRSSRPDPNKTYVESFRNLVGGMNRLDLDFNLKGSETPFCQNLSWHDGALNSRWGQVQIFRTYLEGGYGIGEGPVTCAPFLFHGWMIYQSNPYGIGWVKIQYEHISQNEKPLGTTNYASFDNVDNRFDPPPGTFVRYREDVLFKTKGYFFYIKWNEETDTLNVQHVTNLNDIYDEKVFVPVIQMNTVPATGSGDQFQQENRLTPLKKVEYNVTEANTLSYQLPVYPVDLDGLKIYVEDKLHGDTEYLPDLEAMNLELDEDRDVMVITDGKIILQTAPPVDSVVETKLMIRYQKENPDAMSSILDSSTIAVFGGAQDLCVVIGGPTAQPNAYFWSGNNGLVMDPTYFPMNQYNLAGENSDPITCFGKQQNMLTIFQTGATGRCVFGTETINGMVEVTMNYTRINAEIGCDLPGSLQLVENNLVWCNRRHGVCRLKDSSAAYENNIVVISRKINGDYTRQGLLQELERVEDTAVRSTDTGRKYMLILDENVAYEWNYELSEYQNPSWFFHKGIKGVGFVPEDNDALYEVTVDGKVAQFLPVFMDFEGPIEKIYRLPPRNFGSYDRLKNLLSVIFTTRGDANTNTEVTYFCDYGNRKDATNLVSHHWCLVPRNLARRDLSSPPYSSVFRRKPGYHNIRHLEIQLYNNEAGVDLSIVSADIFYTFRGRQR